MSLGIPQSCCRLLIVLSIQHRDCRAFHNALKHCFLFIQCIFLFSYVWSIGATKDEKGRKRFDKLTRELMNGGMTEDTQRYLAFVEQVPPPMEDYKFPFPIKGSVYDYRLDFTVRNPGKCEVHTLKLILSL